MANTADDQEVEADASSQDNSALFRKITQWYREDIVRVNEWRKAAREEFDFYSNRQWSDKDENALREQNRPAMTFNRIGPLVNAIVGSEINNRREVRFMPREQGDAKANEVLTAAAEWFRDECGAEDEESDAFKDVTISGMGWTDTRLLFDENPDGSPSIENIDAFEMVWDCNAVKPNLQDAQRLMRVRANMTYDDAVELTKVSDRTKLHAAWVKTSGDQNSHDQDEADKYTGEQSEAAEAENRKTFTIVEVRYLEKQAYYRAPDPQNPQAVKEYDTRQFDAMSKLYREQTGQDYPGVKQFRKVVKRVFVGADVLGAPDKPMVPSGLFGWECITGYRDKTKRQFYGIVRAAIDPARWSNKFFSQVMYLLNSQSKGGIMAERGAFENDRAAEASWAKADAITWVESGALSGDKAKIMPKSPAQFPAGFFTLFQESKEAIHEVVGLSMEFIGTREVDQAGVLESQRRQSSLNLLAELFNSLRRYRKRQGRTMLYLIQEHLADGRLVRIVGDEMSQYVPLTKAAVADKEYDIIVDDSPSSPNERERNWAIIQQMLPVIKNFLDPQMMLELLATSPLPASVIEKFRKKLAEQQQQAAQQPKPPTPEEQKMQLAQQTHQLDMQAKQADMQADQQANQMDIQMKGIELMAKQREAEIDAQVQQQKAQADMAKIAMQTEANRIAAQRAANSRTSAAKG